MVGVDPARLTLRQLAWMCAERKRVWGELAAWHLSGVVMYMPFVNARLSVQQVNPYGGGKCSAGVQRVKDFIAAQGIAALGQIGHGDQ